MSYVNRPVPVSGLWGWVNTLIPPTRLIYDAGSAEEEEEAKPIFGTQAYLEWQQRVLAEESARKDAEAVAAGKPTPRAAYEPKKRGAGLNMTTVAVVLIGGYLLLKR